MKGYITYAINTGITALTFIITTRILKLETLDNRKWMSIDRALILAIFTQISFLMCNINSHNPLLSIVAWILSFFIGLLFYDNIYEPFTTRRSNGNDTPKKSDDQMGSDSSKTD